jgi:hypothetical protein
MATRRLIVLAFTLLALAGCRSVPDVPDAAAPREPFGTVYNPGGGGIDAAPMPTGTGYLHVTDGGLDPTGLDYIAVGSTAGGGYIPASAGLVRLPNSEASSGSASNVGLTFRNIGNTADINAFSLDSANNLIVGSSGAVTTQIIGNGGVNFYGGTAAMVLNSSGLDVTGGPLTFFPGGWSPSTVLASIGASGGGIYAQGTVSGAQPYRLSATKVAPTIVAGAGAGSGPTVSITGDDVAGIISVTTGSTPTASATVATITFAVALLTGAHVILQPTGANARGLTYLQVYCDDANTTTAHFVLSVGSSALTGATAYTWLYHVVGG